MYVEGEFVRTVSSLIQPSLLSVTCDISDVIFIPGVPTDVNITVQNYGAEVSYEYAILRCGLHVVTLSRSTTALLNIYPVHMSN